MGSHSARLDRRAFIAGLGAASLAPWPRAALASPHAFDPADDIRLRIIDSAVDLTTRAEAIRLAGVKTVIRYYARGPGQWDGKVLSKPELDALEAQNLSVAVVFQQDNHKPDSFLDENKKVEDLMWARTHADHLQQPEGTPIYFAADFDLLHWDSKKRKSDPSVTEQQVASVKSYFEYAREELAKDGRKLGVYGCGRTCEILEGVADYFWLSASADFWQSARILQFREMAPVPEPRRSGEILRPSEAVPDRCESRQSGPRGFRAMAARRRTVTSIPARRRAWCWRRDRSSRCSSSASTGIIRNAMRRCSSRRRCRRANGRRCATPSASRS